MITYVNKEKLYPSFGVCYADGRIEVRNDLPNIVIKFVVQHEIYHRTDKAKNWIWREIKANVYAFTQHPIGGLYTVFLSLSPSRLKFYYDRWKKNY